MKRNFLLKTTKQKRVANYYDKLATKYDKIYSSIICRVEDKIITSLITKHIKGSVLDVGCGTGLLLDYFAIKKYCGLDISEKMIRKAQTKHPQNKFIVGDMHNIPYPKNTFGTIVSLYGPMSYSMDPKKLLAEFSRVLVPGGNLIIMPYTKRAEHNFFLDEYSSAVNNHISKTYYSSQTLHRLLSNCSYFRNVKLFGINYFANYLGYMAKKYGVSYSSNFYYDLLSKELKNFDFPIEYARHAMVIATKKLP